MNPTAREECWGPLLSEGFNSSPSLLSVSWGSGKRRGAATLPEGAQETSPPCPLVEEVPGLWAARNTKRGWSPAPGEAGQVGLLLQGWAGTCTCACDAAGEGGNSRSTHFVNIYCEPGTVLGTGLTAVTEHGSPCSSGRRQAANSPANI